jgi:hypothetical protein
LKASTPINIVQLQLELKEYPDKSVVQTLIVGLSGGFDTGIEASILQSLECKNNLSARKQPSTVSELLQKS